MALVPICDGYSEEDLKSDSYKNLLKNLTSSFTPKQLGNAFPVICMEKGINFEEIDMDIEFANKKNAQKRFIEVCMKGRWGEIVEIESDDNDSNLNEEQKKMRK